ncbi:TIGR01906 family membrane protein [Agrilactobacillus yilanensis]|uniref:TIGR01906 family membrane protein n=2 Tax=Agrilactobacillus yilanensis TaxID=2485997 RepID=A0ABW4J632_9LACO|nr:TIGR01906 family membrane protein [Agrilactobacillus yilanensis]
MWRLKRTGQIFAILLFLLTAAIFITIIGTFIYYPIDAKQANLPQMVNMTLQELMKNYSALMAYLHFPWLTQLQMPDFPSSANGLAHFADVKKLFILNEILLVLSAIVALPTLKHWYQRKQLWYLYRPFQIGAVLPILIGGIAATNFDQFFITFHHLFFSQNSNWLFDPAVDPIINVLPESFFSHCFIVFFVLFELLMGIGIYWTRPKRWLNT